jgi:REP element-mobilizing transposase RayT
MPLFQKSVVAKQLQSQDKTKLVAQWNVFKNHFHNPAIQDNIRNSKEEQYQGEFLIDLFVNVLGYTKNPTPNFNLTTEYKNVKDSKKADGAILINDTRGEAKQSEAKVKAVIELKGANTTDLNKIEVQAFGYKNNQPDCVYVVTSNFEKLRFYIDNATEYLEFNLFNLTYNEFELLYLCLGYENIANDIPKKLKEQSLTKEKDITKALYTDYSQFKSQLHQDLVKQNPSYDALELFKKSQKLLDRFLFLFFAEDRQLLPPNSVRLILNDWRDLQDRDEDVRLYNRFKKYFEYLNTGFKGKRYDVFAYNGGLFKPDAVLDSIAIDDELLFKHTLKLSEYDFASEVDVNILGHIFENSLNELDELTNEAMGLNPLEKAQTKRKKDGVFYTPKYITKYIVDNTIGKLCLDKKAEIKIIEEDYFTDKKRTKVTKQPLLEKLTTYRNWLLQITICDPACGSGAFLNQALDFLIQEHRYIDELQAKLFGDALVLSDVEKSILENNLYGVDLNEESVEIAKLSLWLRTAQPNRKLNDLNNNIKCGNSLIDDVTIAGEKAFNWHTAFPQVFKEKQKKAYHLVFTTHNSRISQRMIDFKITKGPALELNLVEEIELTKIFKQIILENQYHCLAYNICKDHVHIIIVCQEEEVTTIAKTLKGKSSYLYQSNGFKPIGEPLWSQKFFFANLNELIWNDISPIPGHIASDTYLENAINYIKTNREKHQLTNSTALKNCIKDFVVDLDVAFATEYKGGFDVVIGNPPYVDIKQLDNLDVKYFFKNYKTCENRINLYSIFIEKGLNLIKYNGLLSFINPNSMLVNSSYFELRKHIINDLNKIIKLPDDVFEDAKVETIIFELIKNKDLPNVEVINYLKNQKIDWIDNSKISIFKKSNWIKDKNLNFNLYSSGIENSIINKIEKSKIVNLEDISDFTLGITPYDKYKGHSREIIENREFHSKIKENELYKPIINGENIKRFFTDNKIQEYIKYGDWLGAKRDERFFTNPRILIRQIVSGNPLRIYASYTEESLYFTQIGFGIISKNDKEFDNKYILILLNSTLLNFYHKYKFLDIEKNLFQKILIANCKKFPIKKISLEHQQPFIEKADLMLSLNKELQEQSQKFQRTIQRKFFSTIPMGLNPLEKTATSFTPLATNLPKKLQDWYLLSYADFIKELGKLKIKLTLSQEAEWEDYFTTEATKVNAIKTQIETTDKAIDAMVYELYGLSKDEVAIVENS